MSTGDLQRRSRRPSLRHRIRARTAISCEDRAIDCWVAATANLCRELGTDRAIRVMAAALLEGDDERVLAVERSGERGQSAAV